MATVMSHNPADSCFLLYHQTTNSYFGHVSPRRSIIFGVSDKSVASAIKPFMHMRHCMEWNGKQKFILPKSFDLKGSLIPPVRNTDVILAEVSVEDAVTFVAHYNMQFWVLNKMKEDPGKLILTAKRRTAPKGLKVSRNHRIMQLECLLSNGAVVDS
jgi:hypothetical protein